MKKLTLTVILISLLGLPVAAGAWTQQFRNDYPETNAIYLWMDPATPQVDFAATTFGGGHADWILASNQPLQQFMEGPAKPKGTAGIYVNVPDSTSQPFSFQWAEALWSGDDYTILGRGSVSWNGSGWAVGNTFTHSGDIVHLPLPPAVLLLGSGLLALALLKLRRRTW